jgi:hypothetical protein
MSLNTAVINAIHAMVVYSLFETGFTWPELLQHVHVGLDVLSQHVLLSSLVDAPEVEIMEVRLRLGGVCPSQCIACAMWSCHVSAVLVDMDVGGGDCHLSGNRFRPPNTLSKTCIGTRSMVSVIMLSMCPHQYLLVCVPVCVCVCVCVCV